ncbi:MAG: GGDEF domain-containing protein [Lentisphaerae bacterium]|nr:GGDEF domain-containing protein [Lentisphaerota bacterium]
MEPTRTLGGWLVHVLKESDSAMSFEEALHVIMDSLKDYFPCRSLAVIMIDDDTKELRIKISRHVSYTFVKQFQGRAPGPAAERVVLQQQPALYADLKPGSPEYREIKMEHDFQSAVLAPIVRNRRGVGYIFSDRSNGEPFTESDMLHLQVIGLLVGGLMEKFDLMKERRALSVIDDATGVLQYKSFVPAFGRELARAREHDYELGVILVAVAAFRSYVETHGIDKAHALLAETAAVLKEQLGETDLLARFGADEFVICLSGSGIDDTRAKTVRMATDVADHVIGQGGAEIRVAIGATVLSGERDLKMNAQDILAAAGHRLVEAKAAPDGGPAVGPMPHAAKD